MKPTQTMIENGKQLTATAPNDTMRILSICIEALTEARDELARQENKEQPENSAALISAIIAHNECGIAASEVKRSGKHFEWNIVIDKDHTATLTMSEEDFNALQQAGV